MGLSAIVFEKGIGGCDLPQAPYPTDPANGDWAIPDPLLAPPLGDGTSPMNVCDRYLGAVGAGNRFPVP
jgi:hypothetical protein